VCSQHWADVRAVLPAGGAVSNGTDQEEGGCHGREIIKNPLVLKDKLAVAQHHLKEVSRAGAPG